MKALTKKNLLLKTSCDGEYIFSLTYFSLRNRELRKIDDQRQEQPQQN
jgi:hypothetical protein